MVSAHSLTMHPRKTILFLFSQVPRISKVLMHYGLCCMTKKWSQKKGKHSVDFLFVIVTFDAKVLENKGGLK